MKPLKNYQVYVLAWKIVGGVRGIAIGVEFGIAVVVWAACWPLWSEPRWWDQVIAVLPSLLGFTLGGFAIFLGFGNDDFRNVITEEDELQSAYMSVSAAFLMFVVAQVVALAYALVCMALWRPAPVWLNNLMGPVLEVGTPIAWGVGYLLFLMSLMFTLRAATRIFRISRWYNDFLVRERGGDGDAQGARPGESGRGLVEPLSPSANDDRAER